MDVISGLTVFKFVYLFVNTLNTSQREYYKGRLSYWRKARILLKEITCETTATQQVTVNHSHITVSSTFFPVPSLTQTYVADVCS